MSSTWRRLTLTSVILASKVWDDESFENQHFSKTLEIPEVVIDFHATWCGPCKVLSPILEELEEEVENVQFVKLDVDQFPEIAGANQVMGVPTVVILKDGEVKERFVGVQPKETIKEKITALS